MKLLAIIAVILSVASVTSAQEDYLIRSIKFSGNKAFTNSDLKAILLEKESPAPFFRFTYGLIHIIGGPPVFFDPFVLRADLLRIREFYKNNGFFFAKVDSSVAFDSKDHSVDIRILIHEGPPASIDSIEYHGISDTTKEFRTLLDEKPYLTEGMRYSAQSIEDEGRRILRLLQDDGYAYARRDSSIVTIAGDSSRVAVNLYFSSGERYRWGKLSVLFPDSTGPTFKREIVLREMLFERGDIYSYDKKTESEQRLYALNLFEMAKIVTPEIPPKIDSLDGRISLRPRPAHEITPELLVNDENNAFNFGGGLGYLHRDFLGDARLLSVNTSLLLQSFRLVTFSSKVLNDTVSVGRIDATAQLTQPYLWSNSTSLSWGLSFLVDKEKPYLQLVMRNRVRVSDRLAKYTTGYLDWDIERAKVDSLQAIPLPPGLETPQFNSIFSFTLQRDKTNYLSSPTAGSFNLITLEEGGVLPNLIHSLFKHSDFPYAQYWKFTLLGKWFFAVNRSATNVYAMKIKVGYAQEYGSYAQNLAGPIPLNYRFFAGGSGSIRGWRTRELGQVPSPEYGGTTLLEGNFEDRYRLIGDFGGVAFIDAGNLWDSYKQITLKTIAVAVGFGLRYNTSFGFPLRVDFGFRFYDPDAPAGREFMFQQNGTTILKQLVVHFGIGQAF